MSRLQDAVAGVEADQEPSYLSEMLTSQTSILAMAGSVTMGAALTVVVGSAAGAIPLLAAVAGQSIAALFIPTSIGFRTKVDSRRRRERRERRRTNLIGELSGKVSRDDPKMVQYLRMCEHVLSLDRLAHSRGTAFGENQIESLDEATVDYLAMWLALLAMIEHRGRDDGRSLRKKLTQVEHQLESSTSAVDRKHLERAQSDLEAMMRRRDSVKSRALSVETAMMAMGDAFEEVYQRIVANPGSASDVNHALEDAVQRLRVEEELDLAVDSELEALLSGRNE